MVVAGLSTRMTAEDQGFHSGQAWEALPEPKRQFTFYVIMPDGAAKSFHIGPHAPTLQPQDVVLVHQLWLKFRRHPSMQELHHRDIVTYALDRLAAQYKGNQQDIVHDLQQSVEGGKQVLGHQPGMDLESHGSGTTGGTAGPDVAKAPEPPGPVDKS